VVLPSHLLVLLFMKLFQTIHLLDLYVELDFREVCVNVVAIAVLLHHFSLACHDAVLIVWCRL
jgi:hypothetical protein